MEIQIINQRFKDVGILKTVYILESALEEASLRVKGWRRVYKDLLMLASGLITKANNFVPCYYGWKYRKGWKFHERSVWTVMWGN